MTKLLPLIFMIVASTTQPILAQGMPPPGYPPPGYAPNMAPPGYYYPPMPPPGYYPPYPPPANYYPPMVPPGYANGPMPGYANGPMPDYYYPPMVPQGYGNEPPPGFPPPMPPQPYGQGAVPGASSVPPRQPSGPTVPPSAASLPPSGPYGPAVPGTPSAPFGIPEQQQPVVPPGPPLPTLPPPGLEQPPGAGQEPPLLPAPPKSENTQPDLPPPADLEQVPIPERPKSNSTQTKPGAGILGWFAKEDLAKPGADAGGEHQVTDHFPRGSWTFQTMGGYYQTLHSTRYEYMPFALRWGKLIDCPILGCLGCLEPIVEVNGAPTQLGTSFIGTSLLLRYNFVNPTCKLVPYIQAGVGAQRNNIDRDPSQTALGQGLAYVGQAQVGVRWFLCKNLSFDIEGGYMVFTNFNEAQGSNGIRAVGTSIGLTYYFPMRR